MYRPRAYRAHTREHPLPSQTALLLTYLQKQTIFHILQAWYYAAYFINQEIHNL